MIDECIVCFFVSGEINCIIDDVKFVIVKVEVVYIESVKEISWVDGLSMDFGEWCFNLCMFNIELLVCLNVEFCGD